MRLSVDRKQRNDVCCLAGRQHLLATRLDQRCALCRAPDPGEDSGRGERIAIALVPRRGGEQPISVRCHHRPPCAGAARSARRQRRAPAGRGSLPGPRRCRGWGTTSPVRRSQPNASPDALGPGEAVEQVRGQGIEVRNEIEGTRDAGCRSPSTSARTQDAAAVPGSVRAASRWSVSACQCIAGEVHESGPAGCHGVRLHGEGGVIDPVLISKHRGHRGRGQRKVGRSALEDRAAQAGARHRVERPPGGERQCGRRAATRPASSARVAGRPPGAGTGRRRRRAPAAPRPGLGAGPVGPAPRPGRRRGDSGPRHRRRLPARPSCHSRPPR